MKSVKKLSYKVLAAVMVLIMSMGMCTTTFAAEELNEEQKVQIEVMEDILTGIPSLREMQDARTTRFNYKNFGTEENTAAEKSVLASDAYDEYISESFDERAAAQEAYDKFPEELKQYVDAALVAKLTDTLGPAYNTFSNKINTPTDESYVWQFINRRYERSNHGNTTNNWCQPFVLVDATKYQGQTWQNTVGDYVPGVSNYEVVICCDNGQDTVKDTMYKRMNLEDSEYYSDEAAEHIRAIVMNSYPFVSLEEMKENLVRLGMDPEIVADIDYDDAIASVIWAVWHYSNTGTDQLTYKDTVYNGANSSETIRKHNDLVWYWWGTDKPSNYSFIKSAKRKTEALANFLISLDRVANEDDQIVISSLELDGEPVLIDENGTYEVLLKIALNSSGSGSRDDIDITVTAGENEITIPVERGVVEYAVSLNAKSGDEIKAEVSGTQILPKGAYFYAPKPADTDKDGNATAREVSQNLVGVAVGETPVYAVDSLTFEITEEPDTVSVGLQKTGEKGEALSGAEFTLSYDLDNDGKAEPIKAYEVDNKGFLQIDNLIVGKSYVLTETVAPEGYYKLNKEIKFTVTEDSIVTDDLPAGVTLDEKDNKFVLTVKNKKTPNVLKFHKTTVAGDGEDKVTYPLEGITFDIYYAGTIDDYTDFVKEYAADKQVDGETAKKAQEAYTEEKVAEVKAGTLKSVESVVTDSLGNAAYNVTEDRQPDGIYLIIEQKHPAIVEPLAPFMVAVPMTAEDGSGLVHMVEINPKNEVLPGPEVIKNVTEIGTDLDSFDIGETHTWILRGGVPVDIAIGKSYVMADVLDYRLTYRGNVKVAVGIANALAGTETTTLVANEDYKLISDTSEDENGNIVDTFMVELTVSGMNKAAQAVTANTVDANEDQKVNYKDMEIRVYFDAIINEDAIVGAEIPNEVTLDYKNSVGIQFTDADEAEVYTCGISIHKYDAKDNTKSLAGAVFMLAEEVAEGTQGASLLVIKDENNKSKSTSVVYKEFYNTADYDKETVKVNSVTTDSNGDALIYGLEAGSYYLVEIKAPEGYNLLSYPVAVTLNGVSHVTVDDPETEANEDMTVGVANSNQFKLPETGGMGTTIFTMSGMMMLMAAAFVLVMNKKGNVGA